MDRLKAGIDFGTFRSVRFCTQRRRALDHWKVRLLGCRSKTRPVSLSNTTSLLNFGSSLKRPLPNLSLPGTHKILHSLD
jgi:hypothetical protein